MDVREALHKSRSYRRFWQNVQIPETDMLVIADAARLSPSGRNIQALKFLLSFDEETNRKIFPTLAWAGYLTDWAGPEEGERPSAYIVQLLDTRIATSTFCDEGITAQSMLLQATELGYGGCIIAAVKRKELKEALGLPEYYEIKFVIALGKPKETVVLEDMGGRTSHTDLAAHDSDKPGTVHNCHETGTGRRSDDYRYWRDPDGTHHVPKRPLRDIVLLPPYTDPQP